MQRYESALSWNAHDGEVYSVEFSSDENTVFSIGEDGKVTAALVLLSFSHIHEILRYLYCHLINDTDQ